MDIVLAPQLLRAHAERLSVLVSEFNSKYLRLVGPLKPKFHFLSHYWRTVLSHGPPTQCWTMRFEGNHRTLKSVTNSLTGSVNPSPLISNWKSVITPEITAYDTLGFDEFCHAYEVNSKCGTKNFIVSYECIKNTYPCAHVMINDKEYVVTRHVL